MTTSKAPEALSVNTMPIDMFGRITVYFDGIEISGVVAYNTDAGWVDAHEHDDEGRILVQDDCAKIRRLHGRVVARLRAA